MTAKPETLLGERVVDVIRRMADEGATATDGTRLCDVGFDSLRFAELASALQQELGVDLADSDCASVVTVSDLVRVVEAAGAPMRLPAGTIPSGMGWMQPAARLLLGALCRWWFRLEIRGAERMPSAGPVVLCMNHESMLDIPLAAIASPRHITFMAKRELFANPAGARFFHALGGFSVNRGGFDVRAIQLALNVLERGEVLGMYPEGTRVAGRLLPFLPGAAWLALKTGATLLPCAIDGTGDAMPRGAKVPRRVRVRLLFADPIEVHRQDDPVGRMAGAEKLTGQIRDVVGELLGR